MKELDTTLLNKVASNINTGYELMGSKWKNYEAELIALQTICACNLNFKEHGEALSWLDQSCMTGRQMSGVNNLDGLGRLLNDGSLIQGDYTGELTPPKTTYKKNKKVQVLRVTNKLLHYAASMILN